MRRDAGTISKTVNAATPLVRLHTHVYHLQVGPVCRPVNFVIRDNRGKFPRKVDCATLADSGHSDGSNVHESLL